MQLIDFCNYSALKGRFIKAQGSALGEGAI